MGMDATGGADSAIVRSIVDLAHNLGKRVVAEGVETQGAWDTLAALGCDCAQGYLMGRPMQADDLPSWLAASPWGAPVPALRSPA